MYIVNTKSIGSFSRTKSSCAFCVMMTLAILTIVVLLMPLIDPVCKLLFHEKKSILVTRIVPILLFAHSVEGNQLVQYRYDVIIFRRLQNHYLPEILQCSYLELKK